MLANNRWLLPEGIEEVLPEEAERLERLRREVIDLFSRWGYRLVIPPFIEFFDSLLVGTGQDLDLQTFKLIDQISGRLLGIRADMTPQVARIDARTSESGRPARLCYLGTVLHTQSEHLEKSRSPMQVGAELYGHAGISSDLEIIRLMLEMLGMAGLLDIHLDLGHVGIYRGLARQAKLNPEHEGEFFQILQRKDRSEALNFLDNSDIDAKSADMLLALLDLNGPSAVIESARYRLQDAGTEILTALRDLENVAATLKRLFPAIPVNFDLAELRGYHYQTGIVFAAFVPGYGREVARGGRYDEIGSTFGHARPATGFSADLKVLLRLSADGDTSLEVARIFAPSTDDSELYKVISKLRAQGHIVIEQLADQSDGARAMGCSLELRKRGQEWQIVKVDA